MLISFTVACCGVTEEGNAWAGADGETMEVDKSIGEDLVRCGYATVVSGASAKTSASKPAKVKEA